MAKIQVSRMISVRYVAPLESLDAHANQSCYLDPYTMLSPRQGSMPYVVEVECDWQEARVFEGDQLIVDENLAPSAGDIGIYGNDGALYAGRIYKNGNMLCPIGYEKLNGDQVIFGGVVTRLIRHYS